MFTCCLEQQTFIASSSGSRKSKIKVPANLVCDESLLAGLQMTSLFCPPLAERVQVVVSSFLIKVSSFLIKDTNPTLGAPPL